MPFSVPRHFVEAIAGEHGVSNTELEALLQALDSESVEAISANIGITPIAVRKRLGEVYRKFDILGKGPGKLTELKHILENEYEVRQKSMTMPAELDGVPSIFRFYGRKPELDQLEQWINSDRCRLVAIEGGRGIGKTALASRVAFNVSDRFEIIWRSIKQFPSLLSLLNDLLKTLMPSEQSLQLKEVSDGIELLVEQLKEKRYLIILDDLETALELQGRRLQFWKDEYEGFANLLNNVVSEPHQSCLLLISLQQPLDIELLQRKSQVVHNLGIDPLKPEDAKAILQEEGLAGKETWDELIKRYGVNLLELKEIANTIKVVFNGNSTEFIKLNTLLISEPLQNDLHIRFNRLTNLAKQAIHYLAQEGDAIPFLDIFEGLKAQAIRESQPEPTKSQLIEELEFLVKQLFIQKVQPKDQPSIGYVIQPIIKKYVSLTSSARS